MNVSNVSAGNKTSLPESGTKTPEENSESKGFFETLAGIFTGSQKEQVKAVKSAEEVSEKDVTSADQVLESEGDNLKNAAIDTDINLETEQSGSDSEAGSNVTHSMDEGQQLLGRIEQANQTLSAQKQEAASGNSLPLESAEWQSGSLQGSQTATMFNDTDSAKRISVEELEAIDTKLAQGKSLTKHEAEILEELKAGTAIAELAEEELAQLVALHGDVKLALSEAQSNATRQATTSALTPQVSQELKHAAVQVPAQSSDKAIMSTGSEGITAAGLNPAVQQMAANTEVNHKAMNAALTGALKATTESQDKGDLQHGLAGQLQAAASQQGVAATQQARADAAQQAQLPLQLTKELANDQVAEKVQMMMSKNLKNLDIRLDPPELGRMQIRMTMNSDLASVHFTVTNPQARDIIEQTLPRLREMLAQQGMQLADSSVQQQSRGDQQGGNSAMEQNRPGSDSRGLSGRSDDGLEAGVEMNVNVTSARDGISYYA
ncbi:flagellar hook-length control protein FliK [Vibrio alginolyticus]|nr:flagellar hook-length control protein FliK [Vibrio alginolyticus]